MKGMQKKEQPQSIIPLGFLRAFVPSCLLFACGCVEQTMTIQSDPPGALVFMNDQELGRTPITRDFTWYGDYDVQVRLEGYETLKTHQKIIAPAWNWVPIDLVAYLIPANFKDHRDLNYTLRPLDPAQDDPQRLLSRADYLKAKLEGSPFTRVPTPRAATRPAATRPSSTHAATQSTTTRTTTAP
jgi:PEGA domain